MASPTAALPGATAGSKPRTLTFVTLALCGALAAGLGALVSTYIELRSKTDPWPAEGVELDHLVASVTVFALALSVFTMLWAVSANRRGVQQQVLVALALTAGLGLASMNGIWTIINRLGFGPGDHQFGLIVWALFVFAGLVIAIATAAVGVTAARALGHQLDGERHERVQATNWLWHFAVLVWLVVYWAIFLVK